VRILIVVPQQDRASGNWVTAERLSEGFERLAHTTRVIGTGVEPAAELVEACSGQAYDVALLLHAYRSGKPWQSLATSIPSVVLVTGTDANRDLDDPQRGELVRRVFDSAAAIAIQNPLLADELRARLPQISGKLSLAAAGVSLGEAPFDLRRRCALPADHTLFLCPAGIRPVKGQLKLLESFSQLRLPASRLVFCGPAIEPDYSARFHSALQRQQQACYLGVIPPQAMAAAIRAADVVVNNSRSEGLANSLAEASTLGVPILARDIPGNRAVVEHGVNGLLFDDAASFARYARQLLDSGRRRRLCRPDRQRFNPGDEARQFAALLQRASSAG
jgi:glycosyltransferase involved in cell wall biosynthesis